jgi:deoxyribonuclease-4
LAGKKEAKMMIRFGPAGNGQAFYDAGGKSSVEAPAFLKSKGLNAYEYPCGRGIRLGEETAAAIGAEAAKNGVQMSLHSPYFINLSGIDAERVEKNIQYVLDSCRIARALGAQRIVVHCGGLGKQSRDKAFAHHLQNIPLILDRMEQVGYTEQRLCIETMGKVKVIGTLEEVCQIVALDDRLLPCIDFGHLNAATQGGCNSREDFEALFDCMENMIGVERTRIAHCHFSKIEYGKSGEIRHLTFADQIYGPEFPPLAQVIRERDYTPTIICESAGTQVEDAMEMQETWRQA